MDDASAAYEIITDEAGFRAIQSEWDDLWTRARGWYYQSFNVCWIAWEQIAKPRGRGLHIIVRREAGNAVLIFPLVTYKKALWTSLVPLNSESAEFTSILVEDNERTAALIEGAWNIARKRCGADFIYMPNIPDSTDLYRLALKERHVVACKQLPHYLAKLDEESKRYDWKGFCDSLGALHGKKPGKVEQRLGTAGKVRIDVVDWTDPGRIVESIDTLLTWKRIWGARVDKQGQWLDSEHYRNFLVAWLSAESATAKGHAIIVTVNDTAVAVNLMCTDARGVTGVIASFDPAFAKWSPGVLTLEVALKWAFERSLDFELGPGSEAFKPYWSRGNKSYCCTVQSANSLWGVVALYAHRWLSHAVKRVRTLAGHVESPQAEPSKRSVDSPADNDFTQKERPAS
jgi:CelD/BcsL family acetyltransferase involved in cellulose biosynthesis